MRHLAALGLAVASLILPATGAAAPKGFTDVTAAAGIRHRHLKPVLDHQLDNIMPWVSSVGAAAAAGDYDRDGRLDLYVTSSEGGTPNYLYRNNGDGTFTDVARAAGVADLNNDGGASMDCVWGDADNDGWLDLYVVRWGTDVFLHNNGDGTFTDLTRRLFRRRDGSPGTDWANGCAAIFLDYNLDGRLDLYVGNYFREVDLWHLETTKIMHDDFERSRNAGKNFLYRQEPNGRFTEVAAAAGVDDAGWTLSAGSADLDNDGWPDLYCANDFGPDQLFLNRHDGTFENASDSALGFDSKKGMNVDFGDFNNDGWLDIYVTNITTAEYLQEGNMLWHNNGLGPDGKLTLTDISLEAGVYDGGWGWGAKFLDYDNDGDLDILALNGFISAGEGNYWYDLASWTVTGQDVTDARNWPAIGSRSFSGYERTRLWRNEGRDSFTEVAAAAGIDDTYDGRGAVVFDYDNDGDVDLYVANQDQPGNLYRNDLPPANHWLTVELAADQRTGVNRDAVGTRVTLVTERGMQIRERDGGNGYSGQSDPRLHFGLGEERTIALLEVRWPDGGLQYVENVAADQLLAVRQDPGRYGGRAAIQVGQARAVTRAEGKAGPKEPRPEPAEIERHLAGMEERLRAGLAGYGLASLYRARCAAYDRHDRAVRFFEELVASNPENEGARIQLAVAYVDKIPTCGGLAAVVSKGRLARKSLDQLDRVIAAHGDLWVAYYCRGMNHLHWPRALRHSDAAAADLRRAIELQKQAAGGKGRPHHVRAYVALGDACVKAGKAGEARAAWRDGLALFPGSAELEARLAIAGDGALLKFIESERNLEEPIDTDLSFLDREG